MLKGKKALAALTEYYLKNPTASPAEASRATGTTYYYAAKMFRQRATPMEQYIKEQRMGILMARADEQVTDYLASQAATEGRKDDTGKLPWHLLPPDAVGEILKVLEFGATKYGDRNWEAGMAWSRPFSALMRHMWAWHNSEEADKETGLSHLAHAGCCILFLLAYELREVGTDDRPD